MDETKELLRHFEALDSQLYVVDPALQAKLVKEVLLARQELLRLLRRQPAPPREEVPLLRRFRSGDGYNIDQLQRRYEGAVACPDCSGTDVAVVKRLADSRGQVDYDRQHSQRLRYVAGTPKANGGDFACNRCQKEFVPQLPEPEARLCRMLFSYY
jgi:hypothetical protein